MTDTPLLADRIALVTGGGGGIGAATVRALAAHGATVVAADIDEARNDAVVADVVANGGRAEAVVADVRDTAHIERIAHHVESTHGRLDVLVNNVGHWVKVVDFVDSDPVLWSELYAVNLGHVFAVTHRFLPGMIARGDGAIVNVSSIEGVRGYPPDPVYAAFKAAVVQFTRSLAVQVGRHGVRVNGIAPDVTDSLQVPYERMVPEEDRHRWPDWVPVGRMGTPEDQADVVVFLASPLSRFVTGVTIPTDGGTSAAGGWFPSSTRPGGWTNRPRQA
jgi:NAD(P)-dependent dehydrogenase (short-subunit alcohol dehydrogenase family)